MQQSEQGLSAFRQEIGDLWQDYTAEAGSAQEQAARQQFDTALAAMYQVADSSLLPLSRDLKTADAARVEKQDFDPAFDQVSEALTALDEIETAQAPAAAADAESTFRNARTMLIVVLVAGLALAVAAGLFVARSVSRPLGRVVTTLQRVQQTAKATEEITGRIGDIQASSGSAAAAIGEITEVITQIGDYTTTIASAVEEQTATTQEMRRSVAEAATSSSDVARTVAGPLSRPRPI
jgi:methyl-accepting chemotaxis protein